jgi:hypothetical protein
MVSPDMHADIGLVGATPAQLAAVEARMGVTLSWEVRGTYTVD